MILHRLSLINYKNIPATTLDLSPRMNCFIGHNGAGKTNVLDAVHFLSFCHSAQTPVDAQVIRHDEPFMLIEGEYGNDHDDDSISVTCGLKRGMKKHFKRNGKEYKRLSEHIGRIPLVVVAPADTLLIDGTSEERRKLMDMVISQYDHTYLDALNRYNKALQQRNALLKQEEEPDVELMQIWEEQMAIEGEIVYQRRSDFVQQLIPIFRHYYQDISDNHEEVSLNYVSHCQRGPLLEVIRRDRQRDRIMGFSLHGIHRDDLEITLRGHQMKREGSQGQHKTFVIALKLAQFEFLKQTHTTPILLLDDIFDKLDAQRVEKIVGIVAGDDFGQILITDTNREHLDKILAASSHDYKIFEVDDGNISEREAHV